jgi:hypothetical protein
VVCGRKTCSVTKKNCAINTLQNLNSTTNTSSIYLKKIVLILKSSKSFAYVTGPSQREQLNFAVFLSPRKNTNVPETTVTGGSE